MAIAAPGGLSVIRVRLVLNHQDFGSELEARRGVEEYLAADRREGFSTLTPPLLRVAPARRPSAFLVRRQLHHLLLDARSMTILFREVMDLHDALIQGRDLNLPKPPALIAPTSTGCKATICFAPRASGAGNARLQGPDGAANRSRRR